MEDASKNINKINANRPTCSCFSATNIEVILKLVTHKHMLTKV